MHLTVDAHDVFVATGGKPLDTSKPTIVFLHGAGCDRTSWTLPTRWFAHHGWSVLAPDLPGHGLTKGKPLTTVLDMAAWVERLLDAAGSQKAAIVGHSMGGAIAIETAARCPDRISGLGLVGTAATIPVGPQLLTAATADPTAAYDMMTAWAVGAAAKRGGNAVPGLWLSGAVRRVFDVNAPGVLGTDLTACAGWTTGIAAASRIVCPTTVMTGALDLMTPAKKGADLAKLVAGSRLVRLDGVGHMIMGEAPKAFLAALIAGLTPSAAT